MQSSLSQKQEALDVMKEQLEMERKSRALDHSLQELGEKLGLKQKQFGELKWKFDKAFAMVSDSEIRKVVGIDAFKQKVEKYNMYLTQLMAA